MFLPGTLKFLEMKTHNLKQITEEKIRNMEQSIQNKQKKAVPTEIKTGKYGACVAYSPAEKKPVLIDIDDRLVEDVLKRVRSHGGAEKRWDINQVEGEIAENTLASLMNADGNTVEVKRDFKVSETGNLAIEFMCGGNPSGISTSQAEWWAYALDGEKYNGEIIVLIKKKRLERILEARRCRIVRGGDRNKAEMFLIRPQELLDELKGVS